MDLKLTPLTDTHKALGAKLGPFGGWLMPIQYEGIIAEHNWTRTSASVFDICHMGEFIIEGDAIKSGLDNIVTMNIASAPIGSCRYGSMLNDKGGIIDDLIVYKIKNDKWMLVVNAATIDKDETHIKKNLSGSANFKNISDNTAKLDLQGPKSKDVLKAFVKDALEQLSYYSFIHTKILGQDCTLSRTGYTGELGYEIYIDSSKVQELWEALLKDERVRPAGLGARDTLRLEMGYSLYGQDIDDNITPLDAGMDTYVDFGKDFIGKAALLKQKKEGIKRSLIYFTSAGRRSPRHNYKIFSGGKEAGVVTSGSFSPSLSCGIGIGYVGPQYDKIGSKINIIDGNVNIEAKITEKPFYKNGTAKSDGGKS